MMTSVCRHIVEGAPNKPILPLDQRSMKVQQQNPTPIAVVDAIFTIIELMIGIAAVDREEGL